LQYNKPSKLTKVQPTTNNKHNKESVPTATGTVRKERAYVRVQPGVCSVATA